MLYVSIKSIDCVFLSSFEFKAILLKLCIILEILCFSLLNLCCIFNIDLLFFYKFFLIFFNILCINLLFFLHGLLCSQVELLLNSFYNFQIYFLFLGHFFCTFGFFYLHYRHLLRNYKFLL